MPHSSVNTGTKFSACRFVQVVWLAGCRWALVWAQCVLSVPVPTTLMHTTGTH